jgi:sugar O-acyltransferase (sialic acid O-acetyltransferase NeuD family)
MKRLILVGADIEIIEQIERAGRYSIAGIVDNILTGTYHGYPVLGDDTFLVEHKARYAGALISITLDDVLVREKLYRMYTGHGFRLAQLISKAGTISPLAQPGEGIIIQNGVNIGPGCRFGACAKLNVNANVMHDGHFGDFCTFAPDVVTLGYVETGSHVFFGANATVLPRIRIGDHVIIGAGSVVTKDLEGGAVYAGNPAKKLKEL